MKNITSRLILISIIIFPLLACSFAQSSEPLNITSVQLSELDPDSYIKIGLGRVYSTKYSPDSNTLAVAASTGVLLYDTTTYQLLKHFPDSFVDNLEWSPDGTRIAYSPEYEIKILDLNSGELIILEEKNVTLVGDEMSWSPDSQLLASNDTVNRDGATYIWDTKTGSLIQKIIHPDKRVSHRYPKGEGVDWSSDGTYLAVVYEFLNIVIPQRNSEIIIWDMMGKKPSVYRRWDVANVHENTIMNGIEWALNNDYLVLGGDFISTYDTKNGSVISVFDSPTSNRFALSSNGDTLLLPSDEKGTSIITFDIPNLKEIGEYHGRIKSPETINMSPNGNFIVAGDSFIDRFDIWIAQKQEIDKTIYLNSNWNAGIKFSPDSKHFATKGQDEVIRIYSTLTGELVKASENGAVGLSGEYAWAKYGAGRAPTPSSRLSPDKKWLAILEEVQCEGFYCPEDFTFLSIQSTKTKEVQFSYKVTSLRYFTEWSPDSKWFITTGSPEGWGLTIYSIDPNLLPLQIVEPTGAIEGIDWSPDGNFIAVTCFNGVIYLYKADKILDKFFNVDNGTSNP